MGVRTTLGRWFHGEDEPSAVISYNSWQNLFHGDPNVLGKTVRSESHAYSVVGVAPPEFAGIYLPWRTDVWVPFRFWAGDNADRLRVMVFGTLQPGVAVIQASAELNTIATEMRRDDPTLVETADFPLELELVRGIPNPASRHQAMRIVILLMTVVSLVLLIACVNVGNLLLARGIERQGEVAVRFALGASRARIIRQFMIENLAFCVAGGATGIFVAYGSNRFARASPPTIIRERFSGARHYSVECSTNCCTC